MKKIFLTLTALAVINLQSMDTSSNYSAAIALGAGLAGLYATGRVLCYAADVDVSGKGDLDGVIPLMAPFIALGTTVGSAYLIQGATGLSSEASLALGTGATCALITKGLADRIASHKKIKLTRTSMGITSALLGAGIAGSTKLGLVTAQNSHLTTGIALATGLAAAYGYYTYRPQQLTRKLLDKTTDLTKGLESAVSIGDINPSHGRYIFTALRSADHLLPTARATLVKLEDTIQNFPSLAQSLRSPKELLSGSIVKAEAMLSAENAQTVLENGNGYADQTLVGYMH